MRTLLIFLVLICTTALPAQKVFNNSKGVFHQDGYGINLEKKAIQIGLGRYVYLPDALPSQDSMIWVVDLDGTGYYKPLPSGGGIIEEVDGIIGNEMPIGNYPPVLFTRVVGSIDDLTFGKAYASSSATGKPSGYGNGWVTTKSYDTGTSFAKQLYEELNNTTNRRTHRVKFAGTWGKWQQIGDTENPLGLPIGNAPEQNMPTVATAIPTNDIDDVELGHLYVSTSTTAGRPTGAGNGYLTTLTFNTNGTIKTQKYEEGTSPYRIWNRKKDNSTWMPWQQTYDSANPNPSSLLPDDLVGGDIYPAHSVVKDSNTGLLYRAAIAASTFDVNGDAWFPIDNVLNSSQVRAYIDPSTSLTEEGSVAAFTTGGSGEMKVIDVYGTSKVETGTQGLSPFLKELTRSLGSAVYSGNVTLRSVINQGQFLTESAQGAWTRNTNQTISLGGFELAAGAGDTMAIAFNDGLQYAAPQWVDFYFENMGGTVNIEGRRTTGELFDAASVVMADNGLVSKVRIDVPADLHTSGLFKMNIVVSVDSTKLVGMFASGDEHWTVSNKGVGGSTIGDLLSLHSNPNYITDYGSTLPHLSYVLHGTNDKYDPDGFATDMRAWAAKYKDITNDAVAVILSGTSPLGGLDVDDGNIPFDTKAKSIDSLTRVIANENGFSFISEYQLFGGSIARADALGALSDGVHYTSEGGNAVGKMMFGALEGMKEERHNPWKYDAITLGTQGETYTNVHSISDQFLFGSDDFDSAGNSELYYNFGSELTQRFGSNLYRDWDFNFNTLAGDRFMISKGDAFGTTDDVFMDMRDAYKSVEFFPPTNSSFPDYDVNVYSITTPTAQDYGPFGVYASDNKPMLSTLYGGGTALYPMVMWSGSRAFNAADNKIGKIYANPTGYTKLSGTGYIILEFPTLTRSYEYINGEITFTRRGAVSHSDNVRSKETVSFQSYFVNGSSAAYNPSVVFEAGASGFPFTRNGRIIKDAGTNKMYVVIGEATDVQDGISWAMLENVYFGEDSKEELYNGTFSMYVSATLPTGTVRFDKSLTDADRLEDVLTQNDDAGGNQITNLADGVLDDDAVTVGQLNIAVAGGSLPSTIYLSNEVTANAADQTTAIQTAINLASTSKVPLIVDDAYIARGLSLPANFELVLQEGSGISDIDGTGNVDWLTIAGDNVTISGFGYLEGPRQHYIDNSTTNNDFSHYMIDFDEVDNITIRDITIKNGLAYGIRAYRIHGMIIDNVKFTDFGLATIGVVNGIFVGGAYADDFVIKNCTFTNMNWNAGGSQDADGIQILGNATSTYNTIKDYKILNNTFFEVDRRAIKVQDGKSVVIAGNSSNYTEAFVSFAGNDSITDVAIFENTISNSERVFSAGVTGPAQVVANVRIFDNATTDISSHWVESSGNVIWENLHIYDNTGDGIGSIGRYRVKDLFMHDNDLALTGSGFKMLFFTDAQAGITPNNHDIRNNIFRSSGSINGYNYPGTAIDKIIVNNQWDIPNTNGTNVHNSSTYSGDNTVVLDKAKNAKMTQYIGANLPFYQPYFGTSVDFASDLVTSGKFTFSGDTDNYMSRTAANEVSITSNNSRNTQFNVSSTTFYRQTLHQNGSAASPSLSFTNDSNSGWFLETPGSVGLSVDGAQVLTVTDAGIDAEGRQVSGVAAADASGKAVEYSQWVEGYTPNYTTISTAGNNTYNAPNTPARSYVTLTAAVDTVFLSVPDYNGQTMEVTYSRLTNSDASPIFISVNSSDNGMAIHVGERMLLRGSGTTWVGEAIFIPENTQTITDVTEVIDTIYPNLHATYIIRADAAAGAMAIKVSNDLVSTAGGAEGGTSVSEGESFYVRLYGADVNTVTFTVINEDGAGKDLYYTSPDGGLSEAFTDEFIFLKFTKFDTTGADAGYVISRQ